VFPIADVAEIGRDFGILLIVDNTAPILVRPFDHGAAVVVYSTTKYLGGHSNSIGGLLVDGGNFDWAAHLQRQPAVNTPDPTYLGAIWTKAVQPLGPVAYAARARVTLLRDISAALSPFNAFLILQDSETLALRIRQHSENAQAVTHFLLKRLEVVRVIHPSTQTGVHGERATRYLNGGLGGLVDLELSGVKDAGFPFIDALELFYRVANTADARSLAIHPAAIAHSQLAPDEQDATGVSDGSVRLFPRHRARRRHYCRHRARTGRGCTVREGGTTAQSPRLNRVTPNICCHDAVVMRTGRSQTGNHYRRRSKRRTIGVPSASLSDR
jgi:O-acetylhomoserine (thiol)-lyase